MKELKDMTENEIWQEIKELIDKAPPEYNLENLQWKCDMIREKYKGNPVGAMIEINKLMMESVAKLNQVLQELTSGNKTKH